MLSIGDKIMGRLDELAQVTELEDGLCRRSYTPQHKQANELVRSWMEEAGMDYRQDTAGNIIGRYEGVSEGLPAILIGSHLDTVVMAGKYDGMLGVVTGIACVQSLNDSGIRLPFAVEVIGFADEEGVRYQSTYLGSRAVTGKFDMSLLNSADKDGLTLRQAMEGFGLDVSRIHEAARSPGEIKAYVELHIEQGPVLEEKNLPVGVVTAIAGATRLNVEVTGFAGHAGTVPMGLRKDALAAASECVLAVEASVSGFPDSVATVGQLNVKPGASNVIPGAVRFSVDLRAAEDENRISASEVLKSNLKKISKNRELEIKINVIHEAKSISCDAEISGHIADSIDELGWDVCRLPSGAGHDAAAMADLTPVAMLFVRCAGGVSHNPAESITASDAEAGADVLLKSIQKF